jgi:hypothetical protein
LNFLRCFFKFVFVLLFFPFILAATDTAVPAPLIEQCRDYYNFNDYEKTLETATLILKDRTLKKNTALQEEVLYYINESCEELMDAFQKEITLLNVSVIMGKAADLKKKYSVSIDIQPDGFYYRIIYKHEALEKLTKLKSSSQYIEMIRLKRLLRISRYSTDPQYRFNDNLRILGLYNTYISNYPGSRYLPNLLLKTADLYFSLYEQAQPLKDQINWSDEKIESLYNHSRDLYKKIIKDYPGSDAAGYVGEIKIDNVKLRKDPETKAPVIRTLKLGLLVKIIDRSKERYGISNMYEYWYKVHVPDGSEGWIYGFYLDTGGRN